MATEAQILAKRPNAQESDRPSSKPPISPNLPTIYNLFMQNKANLRHGRMEIKSCVKREYENKSALRLRENKAKQSQLAGLCPETRSTKP